MAGIPGLVNDTPVVFNNMILTIDGETEIPLNGYITEFSWSTGTQSDHVQTINPQAAPITTNAINSSPSCSFTFAPSKQEAFFKLLGNRFRKFTILMNYYVTGNLNDTRTVLAQQCQEDAVSGGGAAMRPANFGSVSYKATSIGFV